MKYIEKQKEQLLDVLSKLYLTHYWPIIISNQVEYKWDNEVSEKKVNELIEFYNYLDKQERLIKKK